MRRRGRWIRTALALGLLLLGGCQQQEELPRVRLWALAPPEVSPAGGDGQTPLRLAVALTISPQQAYQLYGDLAEALGRKIGRPIHLILRRTFAEVNDLVRSRQADMAYLCSRGFLQGRADYGLTALAVPEVRARHRESSYVIALAEGEVGSPAELEGKAFAFADPPCAPDPFPLGHKGRRPEAFFKRTLAITGHDRSIRAVAEGLVDGALVDGLVYARLALTDPALTAKTKVIGETAAYMNPPIAVHSGLDPALRENLRRALLTFHEEHAGRAVLARLGIDRFVAPGSEVGGRPGSGRRGDR